MDRSEVCWADWAGYEFIPARITNYEAVPQTFNKGDTIMTWKNFKLKYVIAVILVAYLQFFFTCALTQRRVIRMLPELIHSAIRIVKNNDMKNGLKQNGTTVLYITRVYLVDKDSFNKGQNELIQNQVSSVLQQNVFNEGSVLSPNCSYSTLDVLPELHCLGYILQVQQPDDQSEEGSLSGQKTLHACKNQIRSITDHGGEKWRNYIQTLRFQIRAG